MTPYIDDGPEYVDDLGHVAKRARTTARKARKPQGANALPSEIIEIICSYVKGKTDLASLARCCRIWSSTAIEYLYKHLELHESHRCSQRENANEDLRPDKDWDVLVRLTRHLHSNPHLALHVRSLKVSRSLDRSHPPTLTSWTEYGCTALRYKDAETFERTVRAWTDSEDDYQGWCRAFTKLPIGDEDFQPDDAYLAVLISLLRNLERLDLMVGHGEGQKGPKSANQALRDMRSLSSRVLLRSHLPDTSCSPFPNLRRLVLSGELFSDDTTSFELEADGILMNVGHLSHLQELTLYCGYLTGRSLDQLYLPSSLHTLKLDIFSFLGSLEDLSALLTTAPLLQTLVITFKSEWQGPNEFERDIDAETIFSAILRHAPTLQNLRFRLPLMDGDAPFTTPLPSLSAFTCLRRIHINSGFVFGDRMSWVDDHLEGRERFREEDPTNRLVDLLPSSIEEFRLCRGDHETSITTQALIKVMEQKATRFPSLRLVIWVMEEDVVYLSDRKDNAELMAVARQNGVEALILARDLDMEVWGGLPSVELPVEDHFWASERTMALIEASGVEIKAAWRDVATRVM
ncbi:Hypothetical protein D9617_9g026230 [Elsinoe fawcettii]|nr:Hypothetical protein D9617_9g026230 [Elsinoe fawcettii]